MSNGTKKDTRIAPKTLIIASLSSVTAALVVSHVWGAGTLIGAGVTPVIVTLVSEALKRPAQAIPTVRPRSARRFDPVAEGRRGLEEGDLDAAWAVGSGVEPARTLHRAATRRAPRRRVVIALATGLVGFAIAAFVLTGSELVFGHSAVSSGSRRTTLFGGSDHKSKAKQTEKQQQTTTTPTTTTTTPTTTTPTTTEPQQTTPQTTPPPTTTTTAPAPAPQAVPPAGGTTAPQPSAPSTTPAPSP